MTPDEIILDDGVFFIDLNCNYEVSSAPGFLERRCAYGPKTPGGFECIGSFDKALDGTWTADVNAPYDPVTDGDCRKVATGASRMDAIAALWRERHSALINNRV